MSTEAGPTGPEGLAYRQARLDDLPAIIRLLADDPLGAQRERAEDPLPQAYLRAFEAIDADPNHELVVAVMGDRIVGVMQLSFLPYLSHQGRWRALIESVRVAADARSGGIGSAMFRWAIDRARQRDCLIVQLTTDRSREGALRFYERLGFQATHHGMKLRL